MENMMNLPTLSGAEIRLIREKIALTQPQFAERLNVSKNQISAWECERQKPSGTALLLITLVQQKGIDAISVVQD